jgi:hypothetical protein
MDTIIEYLIINSPYTKEELIVLTLQQLESLAYTYNMPNAPKPDIGWRNL